MPAQKILLPTKKWIIFFLCNFIFILSLTILLWHWLTVEIAKEQQVQFHQETQNILFAITSRVQAYKALLYGGRGFLTVNPHLSQQEWDTYTLALNLPVNYPGINTFSNNTQISDSEKSAFLSAIKKTNPTFTITPKGTRPTYAVVTYVAPPTQMQKTALGIDIFADSMKKQALIVAQESGQPTLSDKIPSVGKDYPSSFILRLAIYKDGMPTATVEERKKAIQGYISITVVMENFLRAALGSNFQGARFAIYDGANTQHLSADRLFYSNLPLHWEKARRLVTQQSLPIFPHGWTIVFADASAISLRDAYAPFVVLGVGIVLAIVSTLLFYFLLIRKKLAENMAEKMTEKLIERSKELEIAHEELLKLVSKLNEDKKRLEEAMTKDEFLSMAAHELRTPLGTMRWRIEDMLSGHRKFAPNTKEDLGKIYSNVLRLIHIVNNLLDVSRINQGKIKDSPDMLDVVSLASMVVDTMENRIQEKNIHFTFEKPKTAIPMVIDQGLLEEVLVNLLTNAIKYNKKGGKVALRLEATKNNLMLTVEDTGIGIPRKDQKTIFEKFKRGSNVDPNAYEGTGLGLFVVKSYVARWKGKITLRSIVNKGTRITIAIPI